MDLRPDLNAAPDLLTTTTAAMQPTGIVTLLFSDIEGSTRLLSALGVERYETVLEDHRAVLRQVFAQYGGFEVEAQADSFFVAFGRAADAVHAAVAIQCALLDTPRRDGERIRVRIGIHTSEVTVTGFNYIGLGVHHASRIADAAHGAQILVSQTTHDLLEGNSHLRYVDLGEYRLKDFAQSQHLYQVVDPRLPQEFPPLRTTSIRDATNLPSAGESLVGRDSDSKALIELLQANRLVTVVGPGGVGKTSLALVVARQVLGNFNDGTRWVDFSMSSERDHVATAVGAAVGVRIGEEDGGSELAQALANRAMLIVLDNCEHLVTEVAKLVEALLGGSRKLKVLATSQWPLQVTGEHVYRLDALGVPESDTSLAQARRFPAIALLERRARAKDHRFRLDASTIPQAIELCQRLDGLALAIEMAASRLPALGFGSLLSGLGSLRSATRGGPVRQKTLLATLEWSHGLLDDDERAVLRRLAVFAGTFGLESAQHVAAWARLDAARVTDALAVLVDKSLVQVQREEPPRYRLLLSLKEFAARQLASAGEADETARLHGNAMAELARTAEQSSWDSQEGSWLARFMPEYSDMQAAFDRAVSVRDAHVAGVVGEVLLMIENRRAVSGPQRHRMDAAVALLDDADPVAKARLWNCIATPTLNLAPRQMSRVGAAAGRLSAWQRLGDRDQIHAAFGLLAIAQARAGDTTGAESSLAAMQPLANAAWSPRRRWEGLWRQAHVREFQGDAARCIQVRRECVAIAEAAGDESLAQLSRVGVAEANVLLGDNRTAIELLLPLTEQLREAGESSRLAWALDLLCAAFVFDGQLERARFVGSELWALHRELNTTAWAHITLALLATRQMQHSTAAQLLGHADSWFRSQEAVPEPVYQYMATAAEREVGAAIHGVARDRLRTQGSAVSRVVAASWVGEVIDSIPQSEATAVSSGARFQASQF